MKKIRITLCLVLILSLCFGGCGSPAQNSSGDASGQDSSKQEQSSQKEDSKTEESSKVENSSKAELSSKPEESSVSEESSVAQESSMKEESSQLEESSQAEVTSPPEESSQATEAGWASAYLEIVEELQAEYGEGQTITNEIGGGFYGLVVVKLIDFDGDGQEELFCGYLPEEMAFANEAYQRIYGYDNGLITLFDQSAGETGGVNPISRVKQAKDGTVYLIQLDGRIEDYWELDNGEFSISHHVERDSSIWDGEQLADREAFRIKYDEFWNDSTTLVNTVYFNNKEGAGLQTLTDTQETIEYLRKLTE